MSDKDDNPKNLPNENKTNDNDGIEQKNNDHGSSATTTQRQSFPDPDKELQLTMEAANESEGSKFNEANGSDDGNWSGNFPDPDKKSQLMLAPGNPESALGSYNGGDDTLALIESSDNNETGNTDNDNIEARPGVERVSRPFATNTSDDNDDSDVNTYAGNTTVPDADLVENINNELRLMLEEVYQNLVMVHGELNERFRKNQTPNSSEFTDEEMEQLCDHNDGSAPIENSKRPRKGYFSAWMVCLLPIAVMVGSAFFFHWLFSDRLEILADRLNIDISSLPAGSASRSAIEWMAYNDTRFHLMWKKDSILRERYAVVVLCFSTNVLQLSRSEDVIEDFSGDPVCRWGWAYGIDCNDDDEIVYIYIGYGLRGTIPSEIGLLSYLRGMYLGNNQLSGTIPSELGLLTALTKLDLSEGELKGTIPSELGFLYGLKFMSLWDNKLTGSIPSELGLLTTLTELQLARNELTGTIPSELGLLYGLESISLSNNELTGTIPSELGLLSDLTTLSLFGNLLTGTVPSELSNILT